METETLHANEKKVPHFQRKNATDIRQLMEILRQGFRDKNVDLIMSVYSPDIVSFSQVNDLKYEGLEAYRAMWEDCMRGSGTNDYDIHDLNLKVDENLAFCSYLSHLNCVTEDGTKIDHWSRETQVFTKASGRWLICHEHSSVPFDDKSGKAVLNSQPSDSIKH